MEINVLQAITPYFCSLVILSTSNLWYSQRTVEVKKRSFGFSPMEPIVRNPVKMGKLTFANQPALTSRSQRVSSTIKINTI